MLNVMDTQKAMATAHDVNMKAYRQARLTVVHADDGRTGIKIDLCPDPLGMAYGIAQALFSCPWNDPRVKQAIDSSSRGTCVWID